MSEDGATDLSVQAPEPHAMADDAVPTEPVEFTIDELSAHTRVPSRTIRFYQSAGALPAPEIRGRKAFYTPSHVERLKLIGDLQDRGLTIRAIRDVTSRIDRGELALHDWLGLEGRLQEAWSDEEPRMLTEAELDTLLGDRPAGLIAELVRLGVLERHGRSYLAPSPSHLHATLRLHEAGVTPEVSTAGSTLMRKHLARLADELVALYVKNAGDGFGASGSASELGEAFASIRPVALETVQRTFAHEMQRVLRDMVKSGAAARVPKKRK